MDQSRADRLVRALWGHNIPCWTEYTGGGIFVAEIDVDGGTLLSISEDEDDTGGFNWQRLDSETGELVGETPTSPGEYGDLAGGHDIRTTTAEIHKLIERHGWKPVQVR